MATDQQPSSHLPSTSAALDRSTPPLTPPAQQSPASDVTPAPLPDAAERRERKRQSRKRARVAARLRNRQNTSIYLSCLPLDATVSELAEFAAKCGILLPDPQTGRPRIKLYLDDNENPKGDALVTFALRPSVINALQLLDGASLRPGGNPVSVAEAKFDHKKQCVEKTDHKTSNVPRGVVHFFVNEAMTWVDDEHNQASKTPSAARIIILKNVFDPATEQYDMIREDMKEGCALCGEVETITVFERNQQGAVAVKFSTISSALKCIQVMNERWYDTRQLTAELYDGSTDYRYKETDQVREQRETKWAQWLEQSETVQPTQQNATTRNSPPEFEHNSEI